MQREDKVQIVREEEIETANRGNLMRDRTARSRVHQGSKKKGKRSVIWSKGDEKIPRKRKIQKCSQVKKLLEPRHFNDPKIM